MEYINEYYKVHNEDERFLSQSGSVEYITTMKYIHDCIKETGAKKILEVGAGTGRYSLSVLQIMYLIF